MNHPSVEMRTPGAHWLSLLGAVNPNEDKELTEAVMLAGQAGAKLFELSCAPINLLSAQETAGSVLTSLMKSVVHCRFFPGQPGSTFGDPIGNLAEVNLAIQTFRTDLAFIRQMRKSGLTVDTITGPSCFKLGRKYHTLAPFEIMRRQMRFYKSLIPEIVDTGIAKVCVEYLRPGEDEGAIGNMTNALSLVDALNEELTVPLFFVHGDIFHMLERNEKPWEMIRLAGSRLGYLHAHGSKRGVPGSYRLDGVPEATDEVNWHLVSCALDEIGYTGTIVPEPFGDKIRALVPELGEGLPPAIDGEDYYRLAFEHFRKVGILG